MSLSSITSATASAFVAGIVLALAAMSHRAPANVSPQPVCETVRSLRVVDGHGRVTAFIGNVADGSSPAMLLYDQTGRMRSAVMVDSVTGESVAMGSMSAGQQRRQSDVGLRVRGLIQQKGPRHL